MFCSGRLDPYRIAAGLGAFGGILQSVVDIAQPKLLHCKCLHCTANRALLYCNVFPIYLYCIAKSASTLVILRPVRLRGVFALQRLGPVGRVKDMICVHFFLACCGEAFNPVRVERAPQRIGLIEAGDPKIRSCCWLRAKAGRDLSPQTTGYRGFCQHNVNAMSRPPGTFVIDNGCIIRTPHDWQG